MKKILVVVDKNPIFEITINENARLQDIMNTSRKFLRNKGIIPDNYSIFLQLNKTTQVPSYVLKDSKYHQYKIFDKIVDGEAVLSYNKVFTGNKNLDLMILGNLDDKDLFNVCIVNKYANNLCQNELFWKNRFIQKFGDKASQYKPANRNWKNHYLKVVSDLSKFSDKPWDFFELISYKIGDKDRLFLRNKTLRASLFVEPEKAPESISNPYWMLNLGDKIKIAFEIDVSGELDPIVKEYKSDTYFTPAKVIKLIEEFYEEPITEQEYQQYLNIGDPFISDYTLEDVRRGEVKREYLFPRFFEGFTDDDGVKYILFGS